MQYITCLSALNNRQRATEGNDFSSFVSEKYTGHRSLSF